MEKEKFTNGKVIIEAGGGGDTSFGWSLQGGSLKRNPKTPKTKFTKQCDLSFSRNHPQSSTAERYIRILKNELIK
jgi:hypothetical protein